MKLRLSPALILVCLTVLSGEILAASKATRSKGGDEEEKSDPPTSKTSGTKAKAKTTASEEETGPATTKKSAGKGKGESEEEAPTEHRKTGKASSAAGSDEEVEGKPQPAPARKKGTEKAEDAPASTPAHQKAPASEEQAVAKVKKTGQGDVPEATVEATPKTTAPATPPVPGGTGAPPAYIDSTELKAFKTQPPRVQQLIESALTLAHQGLTYKFGSDDPANGGMDCSGSIAYLLRQQGFKEVPRDASGQYAWARKNGEFFAVVSKKAGGFEFSDLQPGDLMFWSGTYAVDKDPPVTHTMIYLGEHASRKQRVMWGSSDGRLYDGKSRFGVGVFDFKMPKAKGEGEGTSAAGKSPDFLGYARIPGLREAANTAAAHEVKETESSTERGSTKAGKEGSETASHAESEEAAKSKDSSEKESASPTKSTGTRHTRERPVKKKTEE